MRWLYVLLALLLGGWLLTGVTQIQPGERAVVRRFGAVVAQPGPGLWIGLPWGIDRVDRVKVDRVRQARVGYDPEIDDPGSTPVGQLLTGDHNLVNVGVVVEYAVRPDEADNFLVQQERVEGLVTRAAEAALAEWVAGRGVDEVLLRSKTTLPSWLTRQTQERLAPYHLGVQVQDANVVYLAPPDEVKADFENVTREQTTIETRINSAREQAHRLRREAESRRFEEEQKTASYANAQLSSAATEAAAFRQRLEQYQRLRAKNPDILASIWWDEMGKVFERLNKTGRIDVLDNHLGPDGLDITLFAPQPRRK